MLCAIFAQYKDCPEWVSNPHGLMPVLRIIKFHALKNVGPNNVLFNVHKSYTITSNRSSGIPIKNVLMMECEFCIVKVQLLPNKEL